MPSVAKGLTLDLALAGSKVGIVEPTFGGALHAHRPPHNNRTQHGGSVIYNYKKYENAGALDPAVLIKERTRQPNYGGLSEPEGLDIPNLPKLRYHQAGRKVLGSNISGTVGGEPEVHYTNRQKALLEHDFNARDNRTLEEKINSSNRTDFNTFTNEDLKHRLSGLTTLAPVTQIRSLRSRPHSSQLDQHLPAEDSLPLGASGTLAQRHSSESLLTHSQQHPGDNLSGPEVYRSQSLQNHALLEEQELQEDSVFQSNPGPLHWRLSPRIVTPLEDLPDRPVTPSLSDSLTPQPPEPLAESASRDFIDLVAKENQQIKRQVQNSLKRLLTRAVRSAGSVSKADVNALQAKLRAAVPRVSPAHQDRRDSLDSQDSGISSDSLTRDTKGIDASGVATATNGQTMEPILKQRRKKNSASKLKQKHKSRSSGKKSRLKSRPDSLKNTNKVGSHTQMPNDQRAGLLSLQAYCQTMQVTPAPLRSKLDRSLNFPGVPVRSSTTAIYKERLPRVPQPTLTCDGSAFKDKAMEMLAVSTYPPSNKKINYLSKVSPRKSFPEPGRLYTGGAVEEGLRLTKVYLSEKQSGMLTEFGIDMPCAPPVTPMPEVLKRVEYIPSMFDIRSQRAVKSKLEVLDRHEKKKKEKQMEQQAKKDKVTQKEQVKDSKRQQRLQIYALNKVMTAWENENFLNFCAANGIKPDL